MTSIYGKTLTGRHIRLIHILPAADADSALECEVKQYELGESAYEALSYVWGDPNVTGEVTVNNQSISITTNLRDALVRLRLPMSVRVLWADALCISQENDDEKNHQVPLMGKIYSQATRVVVWIGNSPREETSAAAKSLQIISDACRECEGFENPFAHRFARLPPDIYEALAWEELHHMFDLPWFERVWCIQEVQLASDVMILWGNQDIPKSDILLSALWMQKNMIRPQPPKYWFRYINAVQMFQVSPFPDSILDTVDSYREFRASDPRDKVYGLINMMAPDTVPDLIQVNYKDSVAVVYADMTLASISEQWDLSVLSHVQHSADYDGYDGFRSWAPRWDFYLQINPPRPASYTPITKSLSACKGRHNLDTRSIVDLRAEKSGLILQGLLFGSVSSVKSIMDIDLLNEDFCPILELPVETLEKQMPASMEPTRALARTLTAGVAMTEHGFWEPVIGGLNEAQKSRYYSDFVDCILTQFPAFFRHHIAILDSLKIESSEDDRHYSYEYMISLICDQRRFFSTVSCSYGLGPACMREGDIVVVLFGGDTPYVLRPKDEGYLLLGWAYVDELMQGKLVDDMEAGIIKQQEFCLL